MKEEAMSYLNEALDYIQEYAITREAIDWPAFRQDIMLLCAQAQGPAQTYPALESALERLGDHHSHFRDPERARLLLSQGQACDVGFRMVSPEGVVGLVFPGSSADLAGIRVGDLVETINGQPMTAMTRWQLRQLFVLSNSHAELLLTLKPAGATARRSLRVQATPCHMNRELQGKRLTPAIGYLDLSGCHGGEEQATVYAEMAQRLIADIDQTTLRGWVVDLRRNTGGNMWPMIAGIGPLLGEDAWLAFVTPDGKETAFYREGQAGLLPETVLASVEQPYVLRYPRPPVAVLTGPLTSSSGEFTTLAFRGRPRTRSFGEATQGVPTANDLKELRDGALIMLTTALGADRTGRIYDGPLPPDQHVAIDWTRIGTADDPVLQAAVEWLCCEEGCL